jgi:hypothetical protein
MRRLSVLAFILAMVGAMAIATPVAAASTRYVDDSGDNTANNCLTPGTPCATIQYAIDQAVSGDTINVRPGSYDETASGRGADTTNATGPYQYGLYFPPTKTGITLQGVTAGDVPVTDGGATHATITFNATDSFGPDSIFVAGAGTTISGLTLGPNSAGENKLVSVIADGFELRYSMTAVGGGGSSIYISDFSTLGDVVKAYNVHDNEFLDGTSVDVSDGAGLTGPVSGRLITDNDFDLQNNGFNGISFNGSGTTVPWYVKDVGGAIITGNSFSNSTQYIRARGGYDNSQFDWAQIWNSNTFDRAAVAGPTAPSTVTPYTYNDGDNFPNTRRISGTIQGAVDYAAVNDTVLVKAGKYTESVVVATNGLTIKGARAGVDARGRTGAESTVRVNAAGPAGSAFSIKANGVTIDGFTIKGMGVAGDQRFGIDLTSGADRTNLHVTNSIFRNLYEGIHRPSNNVDGLTIDQNVFTNDPGNVLAQDAGLWMSGSGTASNVVITKNAFSDMDKGDDGDYAAINLNGYATAEISNNTSDNDGSFLVLVNGTDATITGNTSNHQLGSTIFVGLGNNGVNIDGNTLMNGFRGVRFSTAFGGPTLTQNVTITHNVITNMDDAGIFIDTGTVSDSVSATRNSLSGNGDGLRNSSTQVANGTCNWWGDASGPSGAGPGSGDTVSTNVAFSPWLTSSNLGSACTATVRLADAKISKRSTSGYVGSNIYSSTVLSSQTRNRAVARNQTGKLFVRIQNDGPANDSFTVDANLSGSSSFAVKFFSGTTDVTAAVLAGTYTVNNLAAGAQVTIEVRITAASNTVASATRNIDVIATSTSQPSATDVVRGHITRG